MQTLERSGSKPQASTVLRAVGVYMNRLFSVPALLSVLALPGAACSKAEQRLAPQSLTIHLYRKAAQPGAPADKVSETVTPSALAVSTVKRIIENAEARGTKHRCTMEGGTPTSIYFTLSDNRSVMVWRESGVIRSDACYDVSKADSEVLFDIAKKLGVDTAIVQNAKL